MLYILTDTTLQYISDQMTANKYNLINYTIEIYNALRSLEINFLILQNTSFDNDAQYTHLYIILDV